MENQVTSQVIEKESITNLQFKGAEVLQNETAIRKRKSDL